MVKSAVLIIGYETPFLSSMYGKKILTMIVFTVIGIPIVYLLLKILKRVSFIHNKLKRIWGSFFFNSPLRTFTELYVEISFGFFMNVLNVSCKMTVFRSDF